MVVFLSGSSVAASADGAAILILGDSLSAGYGISIEQSWPQLLQKRLRNQGYRHSVINASISGETTAGGVRRLPALLERHEPAVLVVALGSNDGLRGIAIGETEANLVGMVNAAAERAVRVVLIKVRIPPNYGSRYAERFEGVFDTVGAREDVTYAPFMLERFATDPAAFQADGLHPTATAQTMILDTLWPSISTTIAPATVTVSAP